MIAVDLLDRAVEVRRLLDAAFSPDTAAPNTHPGPASAGHCAAVAVIVRNFFGGSFVSTRVNGVSHWFNRIRNTAGLDVDLDLTGDQFGRSPVEMCASGMLWTESRVRMPQEVRAETVARARLLASRMVTT